jgi:hypothetical protein
LNSSIGEEVELEAKQLEGVHPTVSNEAPSPDSDPEKIKSVETINAEQA